MSGPIGSSAAYRCPDPLWVCEQCGPEWSADDIRATPLRSVSLPQLVAIHVMSLDDDGLRHFVPRLMELMLGTAAPVFDFRLADLKHRLPAWGPTEQEAVGGLAAAIWSALPKRYPLGMGYFSDCASALDFLDWCGLSVPGHLDELLAAKGSAAARHLADLVDAVLTSATPFETASKTTVLDWMTDRAIGERLEEGFHSADTPDVARELSDAHELWTVCRPN